MGSAADAAFAARLAARVVLGEVPGVGPGVDMGVMVMGVASTLRSSMLANGARGTWGGSSGGGGNGPSLLLPASMVKLGTLSSS